LVVVLEEDGRPGVGAVDKRLPVRDLALDIGSRERDWHEPVSSVCPRLTTLKLKTILNYRCLAET
jgi:hypothetical protein